MKTKDFSRRHIGPSPEETAAMLREIGLSSLDELIDQALPPDIRLRKPLQLPPPLTEEEWLARAEELASRNRPLRAFTGYGYYATHMPEIIRKQIFENPAWYTAYTPYQAEISQGRLEALLNYQTMLTELTGMELANASLLDDATAAAEAMLMMYHMRTRAQKKAGVNKFFLADNVFPHIAAVVRTRARFRGIELVEGDPARFEPDDSFFGILWQNPGRTGEIFDDSEWFDRFRRAGLKTAVVTDLMALTLMIPPGHKGADIVTGSTQRLGLPLFYGGPHTGFFVTREAYKRHVPGRIIGVSVDRHGRTAYRMALQTREQHIKREHATSNICTSQVLMAILNGMYAVYHGPDGMREIALHIHRQAGRLQRALTTAGFETLNRHFFDTVRVRIDNPERLKTLAARAGIWFNFLDRPEWVLISTDEETTDRDLERILEVFGEYGNTRISLPDRAPEAIPEKFMRKDDFMSHPVFHRYRAGTELMRYIRRLESKDLSLVHSMIPLGSCTMKYNDPAELAPLADKRWTDMHPFLPPEYAEGYREAFDDFGRMLCEITGLDAVSFQPNSGAAGEYAGLITIRAYFEDRGEPERNVALIPASAHGTNPASAVMAGMEVVVVKTTDQGNIDVDDLEAKARTYASRLAVFMVTYPSTHGVFEKDIRRMTDIIHRYGGLVYMDGANMNAQMGLTSPGEIGADVCHLNLHKTFAVPHGGGGPGAGPILVKSFLKDYLPSHALIPTGGSKGWQVASAPYGSAVIPLISYGYVLMSGAEGLTRAAKTAILNANYLEAKLNPYFPTLYKGPHGRVAHEFIADVRPFKSKGIREIDVAKRLADYGFHAPTVSFPVAGTLMIEPTESETKRELDLFAESMAAIHKEITEASPDNPDNPLKNAPHTAEEVTAEVWFHAYGRQKAAFPLPWIRKRKYWPPVSRIDDAWGDRHLYCTCPPPEAYNSGNQEGD
ncbi:MAG: aminomethyl-transferring glycine dehydrogenase [Chlorobi bacterium]|nr:aminomethyl-transferring glycine dehydrogenase [Chlorobiota bacterium]